MPASLYLTQFRNKITTHGLGRTLGYALRFCWDRVTGPLRRRIRKSWSQAGEDLVIDRLLNHPDTGLYVDVGAHHPDHLSNTRRFYERGWHGINIEPNPDWHRLFTARRPRDTNLNLGIASRNDTLTFHELNARGLSTFSPDAVRQAEALGASVTRTLDIPVIPLRDVFSEHVGYAAIDFLSVDTEGFDYEVLESNDWTRWRPRLLCIEAVSEENIRNEPALAQLDTFLAERGYARCANTRLYGRVLNAIYRDTSATPPPTEDPHAV